MKYLTRTSPGADRYPDSETWKLDVGDDCNVALARADFIDDDPNIQPCDIEVICAIRSLVARVAEFEHLETEKE